jgi:hypothetical protein
MAQSNNADHPLEGEALVKEVCRRIRVARSYWDAHNNPACRGERLKALALYDRLTPDQKKQIPEQLKVWLRYRSEKYFGDDRTAPGSPRKTGKAGPKGKRKSGNERRR